MGPFNSFPDPNLINYTAIASSSTSSVPAGASTTLRAAELSPNANIPAPSSAAASADRGKRQLLRLNSPDDLDYNRGIVRKTRLLYDSLRIFARARKDSKNANKKKLRADLHAGSFMKDSGFCLTPDNKKIVGSVPGVCIGDVFFFRTEMSVVGLHCQLRAGIDYLTSSESQFVYPIATSIITTNGGYDEDHGPVLIYSGNGGSIQKLEEGNLAMLMAMENGIQIRVIRVFHYDGIKVYVYDGLYKITDSWSNIEKSGKSDYKFRLIRIEGQEENSTKKFKLANAIRTIPMEVRFKGYFTTFDMSDGKERVPVIVFNDIDSDIEPLSVDYLPTAVFPAIMYQTGRGGDSGRGGESGGGGCDCVDECNSNCLCAIKNGGDFAYDGLGFLVRGKPMIYECNVNCKCPPNCRNRVSQRGLKRRLEVFRSSKSSWSLRTLELIQAGSFICEYSGVVLTQDQARVISMAGEEPVYPGRFAQNWTQWGDLSVIMPNFPPLPKLELPPLEFAIDVSSMKNVAAYMGHSKSPNVMAQYVLYDHNNLSFPHTMLFALEAIAPMTELTIAYNSAD